MSLKDDFRLILKRVFSAFQRLFPKINGFKARAFQSFEIYGIKKFSEKSFPTIFFRLGGLTLTMTVYTVGGACVLGP